MIVLLLKFLPGLKPVSFCDGDVLNPQPVTEPEEQDVSRSEHSEALLEDLKFPICHDEYYRGWQTSQSCRGGRWGWNQGCTELKSIQLHIVKKTDIMLNI